MKKISSILLYLFFSYFYHCMANQTFNKMDVLSIKGTSQYPEILLDYRKGRIEISGNSLPENAKGFFDPIMEWIDEYVSNPSIETTVNLRMTYYNTPSSKIIFQIFKKLDVIHKNGFKIKVIWNYSEDDTDMREAGIDYSENVSIPFEFKPFKE